MDANIGDIRFVIGDSPPPDNTWAFCEGQLLPLTQYPVLASVLQGIFGGDMMRTIGLPDLKCSIPPGSGAVNFIIYIGPAGQRPGVKSVGGTKRKSTKKSAREKTSKKAANK
jgi:microcystin-dependent protein